MREIKFRLRFGEELVGYEKWYIGSYDGDFAYAKARWMYSTDGEFWNPEPLKHNKKDQFSGFRDSKDKEIYEGDLLKSSAHVGPGLFQVRFIDGAFRAFRDKGHENTNYTQPISAETHTIVGNIYENKDLLT